MGAAAEEEAEAVQAWEEVAVEEVVVVPEQALVEEEEQALVVEEVVGEGEELRNSHCGLMYQQERSREQKKEMVEI